jgi:predicted nucleic acid-binding protein
MPTAWTAFVDTNVLIYSEDGANPAKRQVARRWLSVLWQQRRGRLSHQVLHEFYVVATRKLKPAMAPGDARAEVRRYQRWAPWIGDHATVESAWAIESRFKLHYWDALMAAAAQQQGCAVLLTEDLQHDQRIDNLRIVNPFMADPELLDAAA